MTVDGRGEGVGAERGGGRGAHERGAGGSGGGGGARPGGWVSGESGGWPGWRSYGSSSRRRKRPSPPSAGVRSMPWSSPRSGAGRGITPSRHRPAGGGRSP